ncbi:hypothetical protein L1987_18686 [Smallanthus sonchifolius]|uniref:Uncharacterized protein n=1 Tax=Smallanthus sonchifolius TaxID=185202 RepID=A0ACB9J307_9ASTR|nr:hypothetical protein L1987_18686 [Smallanthus sonchifolius]
MALYEPSWVDAMHEELNQFAKLKVWELVPLPPGKKAIGTRWILINKQDESKMIIHNKARLVVQGFYQQKGIEYEEVFAPVARVEAIRIFLVYASYMNFIVYQMDIKTFFLYGKVKEEIYVYQPHGFEDCEHPDYVYKLDKALYGLHEASRAWYATLVDHLLAHSYTCGAIDQTMFVRKVDDDIILVQIYVDDIILGSTNENLCTVFRKVMEKKFERNALGEMTFFLRLQVKQSSDVTMEDVNLSGNLQAGDVNFLGIVSSHGSKKQHTQSPPPLLRLNTLLLRLVAHKSFGCNINCWITGQKAWNLELDGQFERLSLFASTRKQVHDMAEMRFVPDHNVCEFTMEPPEEHEYFNSMVVGLTLSPINFAIMENPIPNSEAIIREALQFGDEPAYPTKLAADTVTPILLRMGYEGNYPPVYKKLLHPYWRYLAHVCMNCFSGRKGGFNEINGTISSTMVALTMRWNYNFSKMVFEELKSNLKEDKKDIFLMYPRFLQIIFNKNHADLEPTIETLDLKAMGPMIFKFMNVNKQGKRVYQGLHPLEKFGRFAALVDEEVEAPVVQVEAEVAEEQQLPPQPQIEQPNEPQPQDPSVPESEDAEVISSSDSEGTSERPLVPINRPQNEQCTTVHWIARACKHLGNQTGYNCQCTEYWGAELGNACPCIGMHPPSAAQFCLLAAG